MIKPSTIVLGIAISIGASLAWKYISEMLDKFRFKITGYGIPSFQNWILKVPITVSFNNPTGIAIKTDQVIIDVYIKNTSGQFSHVGEVKQPFTLPPGKSSQTVVPVLNLQSFSSNIINNWKDIISTRSATIRTDITVFFQGVKLPAQKFIDTIKV